MVIKKSSRPLTKSTTRTWRPSLTPTPSAPLSSHIGHVQVAHLLSAKHRRDAAQTRRLRANFSRLQASARSHEQGRGGHAQIKALRSNQIVSRSQAHTSTTSHTRQVTRASGESGRAEILIDSFNAFKVYQLKHSHVSFSQIELVLSKQVY